MALRTPDRLASLALRFSTLDDQAMHNRAVAAVLCMGLSQAAAAADPQQAAGHEVEPATPDEFMSLLSADPVARRQAILDSDDVVEVQLRWWPRLSPAPG